MNAQFLVGNEDKICTFYHYCCTSDDLNTKINAAYNLPCMLELFGGKLDLIEYLKLMLIETDSNDLKMLIGKYLHELFIISERNGNSVMDLVPSLISLLQSEEIEI